MSLESDVRRLEARVTALERIINSNDTTTPKPSKTLSIREFINNAGPETQNDRVLVIAYFYEHVLGNGFFTNDDLKSGYAQAKIIGPKNYSDAVAQNAKKGLIMEDVSQPGRIKAWVLTNTGEGIVTKMLEKND